MEKTRSPIKPDMPMPNPSTAEKAYVIAPPRKEGMNGTNTNAKPAVVIAAAIPADQVLCGLMTGAILLSSIRAKGDAGMP